MMKPMVFRWCVAGLVVWTAFLAGCAEVGRARDTDDAEIVTESDEPEARKRARLRVELATGYFEQGRTNIALDEIKQALVADPGYASAFNLRGLVYMRMGENRLAEESFRKAVSLSPRDGSVAHNLAWLLCQQGRYTEADPLFEAAANSPRYGDRAKTWMTQGICLVRAGQPAAAERVLLKAYELDAGNPVTGFNLARLTFSRGDHTRAQFYIRRINNSELANAETLWLGMRVEHRLQNAEAVRQLADQLRRRFPQSREWALYERGGLND